MADKNRHVFHGGEYPHHEFYNSYRGRYSQYWVQRWGIIPQLPTSFDNSNDIYELLAWLQRAFKFLLDDFLNLELEFEEFKNAITELIENLVPQIIEKYVESEEFYKVLEKLIQKWFNENLKERIEKIEKDVKDNKERIEKLEKLYKDLLDLINDLLKRIKDLEDKFKGIPENMYTTVFKNLWQQEAHAGDIFTLSESLKNYSDCEITYHIGGAQYTTILPVAYFGANAQNMPTFTGVDFSGVIITASLGCKCLDENFTTMKVFPERCMLQYTNAKNGSVQNYWEGVAVAHKTGAPVVSRIRGVNYLKLT